VPIIKIAQTPIHATVDYQYVVKPQESVSNSQETLPMASLVAVMRIHLIVFNPHAKMVPVFKGKLGK